MRSQRKKRVIVGVSGASGMPLALRLLRELRGAPGVETHLIVSPGAARLLEEECACGVRRSPALRTEPMTRATWPPGPPAVPGGMTA